MKKGLIICALLAAFGVSAQESEVVLSTGHGSLYGTLARPEGVERPDVVLIVAGSGPVDRNGNTPQAVTGMYRQLSDSLRAHGIASLRYDKRGIGRSAAAMPAGDSLRYDHYIDDAAAWIRYLRREGNFGRIVAAGHSEGAHLVTEAALRGGIDGIVLLCGAGYPVGQVLKYQLAELPTYDLLQIYSIIDRLEAGERVNDVPQSPAFALFAPQVQDYLISWMRFDPARSLAEVKCPMLIVQGGRDIQVTPDNGERLRTAAPKARYLFLPDLSHPLKRTDSSDKLEQYATVYTDPDLPLDAGLVAALADFIVSVPRE